MTSRSKNRSTTVGLCGVALSCAAKLVIVVAASSSVYAQTFEVPSNRLASQILPSNLISSPYHRVRETVVSYGYMHHYTVDSQFGVFEATGDGALRKLVNELYAIASLKEFKNSDAFLTSVGTAVKGGAAVPGNSPTCGGKCLHSAITPHAGLSAHSRQ